MISRLRGQLLEKQAPYVVVDVQGVAYEAQAPMTSFYPMPDVGQEVILHTHLSVSENAHQLFAFYTQEERRLFRTLIKVNGVGPKLALAILSGMAVEDFVHCVMSDNVAALVKVPGVGRKTAERLVVEIKDKLSDWQHTEPLFSGDKNSHLNTRFTTSQISADAESALIALGYKPTDAAKVISLVQQKHETDNSEELIRLALQSLAS